MIAQSNIISSINVCDTDRCQHETPLYAFLDALQESGDPVGKPAPASRSLPRRSNPEGLYFHVLSLQVSNSKMYFHDVLGGECHQVREISRISEGRVKWKGQREPG